MMMNWFESGDGGELSANIDFLFLLIDIVLLVGIGFDVFEWEN